MANICYNKFYLSIECAEDIFEDLVRQLEDKFNVEIFYDEYNDDCSFIDGGFDSNWSFPHHLFKGFFESFDNDTIYFRCLSEEYGCNYIALNIYEDGKWKDEQTFNF